MRALALLSGGLDSQLAVRVIQSQDIEVVGVHFFHRFNKPGEPGSWPDTTVLPPPAKDVERVAERLGVQLVVYDFSKEFVAFVNKPQHGRGKGFNPCVDCRITMLSLAKTMMPNLDASFVITGEVLGQRPMTQVKHRLNYIAKHSSLGRLLLRPLSAQRLSATLPEEQGWVDRDRLLDICGRGRKAQMALAPELGITEYPQPAGGCFLTDLNVASHFFSWVERLGSVGPRELVAFRLGRHFILPGGNYAVAGRDQHENEALQALLPEATQLVCRDVPSSSVFVLHETNSADLLAAAGIAARYSKARNEGEVIVSATRLGAARELSVSPLSTEVIDSLRV